MKPAGRGSHIGSVILMGGLIALPAGIQWRWQHRVVGRSTYNFAYSQDSFSWKTGSWNRRNELAETRLLGAVSVHVPPKGCQSLQESVAVAAPLLLTGRKQTHGGLGYENSTGVICSGYGMRLGGRGLGPDDPGDRRQFWRRLGLRWPRRLSGYWRQLWQRVDFRRSGWVSRHRKQLRQRVDIRWPWGISGGGR